MKHIIALMIVAGTLPAQVRTVNLESPEDKARLAKQILTDPILTAMAEEFNRGKQLRALGDAIHYLECNVDDAESFGISSALGSVFSPNRARMRPVRIEVRVGTPQFDNTNSVWSDYYSGTRFDSDTLPLDNDILAMRQTLWLGIDRGYKSASEALGRKAAALKGITANDQLPDFWSAPAKAYFPELKKVKVDEAAWTERVKALSSVFLRYPEITQSGVDFESSAGNTYHMDSNGTVARYADAIAILRVRAALQAEDGMPLYDGLQVGSLDVAKMPPNSELLKSIDEVAASLKARAQSKKGEAYSGPVLFEARAAAQIFGEVFGYHLGSMRKPVSDPSRPVPISLSEFEGRIGSRVLPDWMSIVDDPAATENAGRTLQGSYVVDMEGVFPERLSLIENGVLKAMFTTRQPIRGMNAPNGRARLPGVFGNKTARMSNLFVTASKTVSDAALKKQMLDMIQQQNKPYGLLVRRMDFPSSGSADDLRRVNMRAARSGAGGRPVSTPILIYKIFPDGREELVRGLRFRSLTTRSFRDILAASDKPAQFDFVDNGAPLALMGAGTYVIGCSVIAPALLFEELELEPSEEDLPKTSVVPPPPFAARGAGQ